MSFQNVSDKPMKSNRPSIVSVRYITLLVCDQEGESYFHFTMQSPEWIRILVAVKNTLGWVTKGIINKTLNKSLLSETQKYTLLQPIPISPNPPIHFTCYLHTTIIPLITELPKVKFWSQYRLYFTHNLFT
jgi:hypothetical protein